LEVVKLKSKNKKQDPAVKKFVKRLSQQKKEDFKLVRVKIK